MAQNNPAVCPPDFTFNTFLVAALAGGFAGTSIDLALFPVDSIKTRLQASSHNKDFTKSAASVSKFRGLTSSMAASFPCAAVFWLSYEYSKYFIRKTAPSDTNIHIQHLLASACAEVC